jgi:predicted ABC-type ATPase
MPQIWIVAGPNGAGKTTVTDRWFTPRIPVVSPDTLAFLQKLNPLQAGRAAIQLQERLLADRSSFSIDTTFSGKRELVLMRRAAAIGYKVNLVFICLETPALCQARVLERVGSGGMRYRPRTWHGVMSGV